MRSLINRLYSSLRSNPQLILAAILIVRCILSLPIVTEPYWEQHEADFYNVARFLIREGRVPTPADFPDQPGVILQSTQPPVYYAIAIPVLALFDGDQPVPPPTPPATVCFGFAQVNDTPGVASDTYWYAGALQSPLTARLILRLLSLALTTAALVVVYATARLLAPKTSVPALLAVALLSFEPNTFSFTSIVNNDPPLLLLSALNLYAGVRILTMRKFVLRDWILLAVTTILAILTRLNGWALLPLTGIVFLLALRRHLWAQLSPTARRRLLVGVVVLVILVAGIAVVNLATTGSLLGRYRGLEEIFLAKFPNASVESIINVGAAVVRDTALSSYLAPYEFVESHRLVTVFGWFTLVVLALALVGIVVRRWREHWGAILALVASVALTTLLVFARNSIAVTVTTAESSTLIYAPIRYYVPALPAAVILIALGLAQIRFAAWLGGLLAACWLGAVMLQPQPAPPYPVLLSDADSAMIASLDHAENLGAEYPQVSGYSYSIDEGSSLLDLHLVTSAAQPLSANYAARLVFTAPDGRQVSCQFHLANGLYPTHLWKAGEQVQTEVRIPNCMSDLPADTSVDLRWDADDGESAPLRIGQLDHPLARAPACPPLLGVIDDNLLVMQYTAPLTVQTGTLYLPAVNWYAEAKPRAHTRVYTLTQIDGAAEYTCASQPRLDSYPFSTWRPGETIYFDECRFNVPEDAPPGKYRVTIGAKDIDGNWLPAADASGQPLDDPRIAVAEVEFTP